ncbi:hypothetical protein N825_35905 [Skermanella stibiiresistens SB22]|uniref:Uncharacterized protein n=1 Tax=Skermanella stibiiresistens SB22 TaxID=1385369 RepID=W9GWA2_9PROT|nr:hypothetical protein N825_35905 [Skermanella stibiiresistens SB22]
MIVNDDDGLHPGIDDRLSDELEVALLERLRYRPRELGLRAVARARNCFPSVNDQQKAAKWLSASCMALKICAPRIVASILARREHG